MKKAYDVAIIGGGILGVSIAFQLSRKRKDLKICLIEKEKDVAQHTSGRNTGVIHRPFYLNPETKPIFARCANESFYFWKNLAVKHYLPWRDTGTLEVAWNKSQLERLEKYFQWAVQNGMRPEEVELLSGEDVKKLEPGVVCQGALWCKTDASVDFGVFTKTLKEEAKNSGVEFFCGQKVREVLADEDPLTILFEPGARREAVAARFVINAAGGNSLKIAKQMGWGRDLTCLYVRGEYWEVGKEYRHLVSRNIYSVPENPHFPFLDPHWVCRADGRVEIGPNAVPVFDAYDYRGLNPLSFLKYWMDRRLTNKLRLFANPEFLGLAIREWKSSLSKTAMTNRVKQFIPSLHSAYLTGRGVAGVRATIIRSDGTLAPEAIELGDNRSFHILNFNSPGATGAPVYAERVVAQISSYN